MCNMRFFISLFLVAVSYNAAAELWNADDEISDRARSLLEQCDCDPGALHHQLEAHYQGSRGDGEWSPRAEVHLSSWFEADGNSDDVAVSCVVDMCVVDFFVPFSQFSSRYKARAAEWEQEKQPGFLRISLFFPRWDGSTRLFIFRDSFDPAAL